MATQGFQLFGRKKLVVLSIGNLQFEHTILGRTNMMGLWCIYCTLAAAEWSELIHSPGSPWTLDLLRKFVQLISEGKLAKGKAWKGVVPGGPIMDVSSHLS